MAILFPAKYNTLLSVILFSSYICFLLVHPFFFPKKFLKPQNFTFTSLSLPLHLHQDSVPANHVTSVALFSGQQSAIPPQQGKTWVQTRRPSLRPSAPLPPILSCLSPPAHFCDLRPLPSHLNPRRPSATGTSPDSSDRAWGLSTFFLVLRIFH